MRMLCFLLVLATNAIAGPFGLSMGDHPEKFGRDAVPQEAHGMYYLMRPPVPHRAFDRYAMFFSDKSGLARIRAVSPNIATSSFGTQLRSEFMTLVEALSKKYGKPTVYERVKLGTSLDDPRLYMSALLRKDRILAAEWKLEAKAEDGLSSVELTSYAISNEAGFLMVTYDFSNASDYLGEARAKDDAAL